jgi:hypothetical protein
LVVPIGNSDPDTGTHDTIGDAGAASTADTEKLATAPLGAAASIVIGAGNASVGGVTSTTTTEKVPVA